MDTIQPFLRIQMRPESRAKLEQLVADIHSLLASIEGLPKSEANVLQPLLDRFLHIVGDLAESYFLVEGTVNVTAARTCAN